MTVIASVHRYTLLFGIVDHTAQGMMHVCEIAVLEERVLQRLPRDAFFTKMQQKLHQVVKLRLARAAAAR